MTARTVQLILSDDVVLGSGKDGSAIRKAWTLYTLDGARVGQFDPFPDTNSPNYNGWHDTGQLHRLMMEGT